MRITISILFRLFHLFLFWKEQNFELGEIPKSIQQVYEIEPALLFRYSKPYGIQSLQRHSALEFPVYFKVLGKWLKFNKSTRIKEFLSKHYCVRQERYEGDTAFVIVTNSGILMLFLPAHVDPSLVVDAVLTYIIYKLLQAI